MDSHPRARAEAPTVDAKNEAENVVWTFRQNHLTVDKTRLKDVWNVVAFVEERQTISHEKKDFAECINCQTGKRKERTKPRVWRNPRRI